MDAAGTHPRPREGPVMTRPAFVWSPHYEMDIGRHVFPTEKFRLTMERLVAEGRMERAEVLDAPMPSDEELLAVLEPEYLRDLRSARHTHRTYGAELPISEEIVRGVSYTAGGTILCMRRALECGAACHLGGGFHHGFADHGEGFCYVNDVAIAAEAARREGLARRIAIVDTDVHQGNGTARIFGATPEVFTFSIHQELLYPFPKVDRSDLDIGLPATPGERTYLGALERGLRTAVDEFRPDLLLYVAGVDPYEGDQLGDLGLTMETMKERDRMVLARVRQAGIPFVTVTAGGYARELSDTVALHAQTVAVALEVLSREDGTPAPDP